MAVLLATQAACAEEAPLASTESCAAASVPPTESAALGGIALGAVVALGALVVRSKRKDDE
jgi:hypothetical protein